MKRFITICMLTALLIGGAQGAVLWGTSHSTSGFWQGGSIWTYDTVSKTLSVKATYDTSTLIAFGDIAVRADGEVYVTYATGYNDGFDKLAKVNTTTWGFDWVQDLGGSNDQVNALEFIDGQLYGVTGGGIDAYVLKFTLTGTGAIVSNLGKIGKNSDGDLTKDPVTGNVYYTSWEATASQLNILDLSVPSETMVAYITGGQNGWAGLACDQGGTLWAGNYYENKLYTLDKATAAAAYYDTLTGVGTVTGLSIPEPATMALLALGGLVLRKRR
jgi:hypothetical protein